MRNNRKQRLIGKYGKNQRGYTLLEYCAGAAVIAGIVWIAVGQLGGSMRDYLTELSGWLNQRAAEINDGTAEQNSGGGAAGDAG